MSKNLQFLSGYFRLFFLLITSIVFGQIDITDQDAYFKIIPNQQNNAITDGEHLIVQDYTGNAASVTTYAVSNGTKSFALRTGLSVKPVTSTLNQTVSLVNNRYITTATNENDIKYILNKQSGQIFSIYNISKQQFLKVTTTGWLIPTSHYGFDLNFSSNNTDASTYSFQISNVSNNTKNRINNLLTRSGVNRNMRIYNDGVDFSSGGDSDNLNLYRRLQLDWLSNEDVFPGDEINLPGTDEFGSVITYNIISPLNYSELITVENLANGNKKVKILYQPGYEIIIEAVVAKKNDYIPSYKKRFKLNIVGDEMCFNERFPTHLGNGFNDGNIITSGQMIKFPIIRGKVYQIPSGVKIGSHLDDKAAIISEPLSLQGDVTVELDVQGNASTSSVDVQFIAYKTNGTSRIIDQERILVGQNNTAFGVNYLKADETLTIPSDALQQGETLRLKITTEVTNTRVWIHNVRINCNPPTEYIWENQKWYKGGVITTERPKINNLVRIKDSNLGVQNIFAKKLTIDPSASSSIVVENGSVWVVRDKLETNNKTIIFEKGAYLNLVNNESENQYTDVTGNLKFKTFVDYYRFDTHSVSSPVQNNSINNYIGNLSHRLFIFDNLGNEGDGWLDITTNNRPLNFLKGVGYSIQKNGGNRYYGLNENNIPNYFESYFEGKPYNENFTIDLLDNELTGRYSTVNSNNVYKLYSLGNPYPAPINIDRFLNDNKDVVEHIEIWRNDNHYNSTTRDYVNNEYFWIICSQGGCLNDLTFNRIDLGVGFNIKKKDNSQNNINFNLSQRSTEYYSANMFDNNRGQQSVNSRFILELQKNNKLVRPLLLGHNLQTSYSEDKGFDVKFESIDENEFVSIVDSSDYVMDFRSYPIQLQEKFRIRYKVSEAGEYSIKLSQFDGDFIKEELDVYIYDNYDNSIKNLKELKEFVFYTEVGNFDDRFEIRYQNKFLDNVEVESSDFFKLYYQGTDLHITSTKMITSYDIFDLNGGLIYTKKNVNSSKVNVNKPSRKGIYLIKIKTLDGDIVEKKFISK